MNHDTRTTHTTAAHPDEEAMLKDLVELSLGLQAELQAFADATGKHEIAVSIPVRDDQDAARLPLLYAFLKMVGIDVRPQYGSDSDAHVIALADAGRPVADMCGGR